MHIHDLTLLMSHDIHNDITNMNTIREHIITQGLTRINEMRIRGVQPPKTKKKPQQRPRSSRRVPIRKRRYSFIYDCFDIVWLLFRKYLKILAPI